MAGRRSIMGLPNGEAVGADCASATFRSHYREGQDPICHVPLIPKKELNPSVERARLELGGGGHWRVRRRMVSYPTPDSGRSAMDPPERVSVHLVLALAKRLFAMESAHTRISRDHPGPLGQ